MSRSPLSSRTRRYSRHRRSRSRSPGQMGYEMEYKRPYRRSNDSRSPSGRRRHQGTRDNPEPSKCLGVFGLSIYTQERDLRDVFTRYGPLLDCQIVYDAQTSRSRGFAFVYYETADDAQMAKEKCNGIEIDGRKIRVDYSITQRAHTPTPGVYMGKPTGGPGGIGPPSGSRGYRGPRTSGPPTYTERGGASGGGIRGEYHPRSEYHSRGGDFRDDREMYSGPPGNARERSPSPYYRRRFERSRSRSYSPRGGARYSRR